MGKRRQKACGRPPHAPPTRRVSHPVDRPNAEDFRATIRKAIAALQAMEDQEARAQGRSTRSKTAQRAGSSPDPDPNLATLLSSILAGKQQAMAVIPQAEARAKPLPQTTIIGDDPAETMPATPNSPTLNTPATGRALQGTRPKRTAIAGAHASLAVEPWRARALQLIFQSVAPSTLRGYTSQVMEFQAFRLSHHIQELWPVPPEHLMHFIVHMRDQGRAVSSLAGSLAAISFVSQAVGLQDFSHDFRIRCMLQGAARMTPPLPRQQKPSFHHDPPEP